MARRALVAAAALSACGAPSGDAPGGALVDPVADGWTLGPVQACDTPAAAPTWSAGAPAETYTIASAEPFGMEPGAVAVVETADDTWVVWTPPNTAVRALSLGTGALRTDVARGLTNGFALGDLDNDGAVDLVASGSRFEVLWAFGTADEVREELDVQHTAGMTRDASITDLDGDGLLDLLVTYSFADHTDREIFRPRALRNLGDRAFAVTDVAGNAATWGTAFDTSVIDADDDGDLDVYVCNDMGATVAGNYLLRDDGDAFVVAPTGTGLDVVVSCMGASWGDADGDGRFDVHIADSARHILLLGDAGGWYDSGAALGLSDPFGDGLMPWGVAFDDLDNDGATEIVVTQSEFAGTEMTPAPLLVYANAAGAFVEDAATRALPGDTHGRGLVVRDLDGDGVPELVMGDALRAPWVLWSDGCTADTWLDVAAPHGARVTVEADGRVWTTLVTTEAAWGSAGPARAHVGLGAAAAVDSVTVAAPGYPASTLEGPFQGRRRVTFAP